MAHIRHHLQAFQSRKLPHGPQTELNNSGIRIHKPCNIFISQIIFFKKKKLTTSFTEKIKLCKIVNAKTPIHQWQVQCFNAKFNQLASIHEPWVLVRLCDLLFPTGFNHAGPFFYQYHVLSCHIKFYTEKQLKCMQK